MARSYRQINQSIFDNTAPYIEYLFEELLPQDDRNVPRNDKSRFDSNISCSIDLIDICLQSAVNAEHLKGSFAQTVARLCDRRVKVVKIKPRTKNKLLYCVLCRRIYASVEILIVFCDEEASASFSLSLIHISEPTRLGMISYAVFCLKKKK